MEKEYTSERAQNDSGSKEHRDRNKHSRNKRQMYIKLKNQMEFYFSPSNIARDKFVGKMLQENSQIELSIFLTFNKIKEILSEIPDGKKQHELAKSLATSDILQLTEDKTKVFLKNEIPKKTQQEIDELTIYVEQIPLSSTHDSIKGIFSKYGKINYISLPRYKKSGQIKQFCFIEFDDLSSVQNVLQAFKKFDALLAHQTTKPENLLSIKTFEKDDNSAKNEEQNKEEIKDAKNDNNVDDESPPPAKRLKLQKDNDASESAENCIEKEVEISNEKTDDKVNVDKGEKEEEIKKKLRKHKRNQSKKKLVDERVMAMKVMKKTEWKKLRNTYLTLERQKAKEIKKILRESYNKRSEIKNQPLLTTPKESPKISFYGSPDHFNEQTSESNFDQHQINSLSNNYFTPGCIVNIKFREPCVDCKEFKKELKQFPFVQYVDIPEAGTQCFIRVDASQAAHELVNHYSSCEYETEILKDDLEKEYWRKIFENRDKKKRSKETDKNKTEKRKRRRGREKLAIKISKVTQTNQIIRFSEFEDHAE